MIICTNCGFSNEDEDSFCGGCQEFLEWTGEVAEAEVVEVEAEELPTEEERRSLVDRVVERFVGVDDEGQVQPSVAVAESAPAPTAAPASGSADTVDETASLRAETAERAEREAEEAQRAADRAQATLRANAEAAERARQRAEEAAEAQRAAEAAVGAGPAEVEEASAAEATAPAATEEDATEPPADVQAVEAEVEQAARHEAEAGQAAAREAAEAAAREAEEAEEARRLAEERARKEAEAAERARRAAALVARPPAPPPPAARQHAAAPATRPSGDRPRRGRRRQPQTEPPQAPTEAPRPTRPDAPAAVKPGRSKVRPTARPREAPTRQLRPGDLICGKCGEGNAPTRNFCRRCGHQLAEAEVVRPPWWKRLVPRRRKRTYAAGDRPSRGISADRGGTGGRSGAKGAMSGARGLRRKVMGPIGKVGRPLMLVGVVLAALGISFNPGLRGSVTDRASGLFDRARSVIAPQYEPVTPVGVTASSALPDHPAESAIDNTSNRWWAEGAEGSGEGQSLVVTFAEPVDIAIVGVTPGAAETEEFVAQPRPRRLHLVFDTGVTADLELADEHAFQTFQVDAPGATSVEVQILEVWQGQSGSDLAITTLEFRTAS